MNDIAGTFLRQFEAYLLPGALALALQLVPLDMPAEARSQENILAQLKSCLLQGNCVKAQDLYKQLSCKNGRGQNHKNDFALLLLTVQARNIHACKCLLEAGADMSRAGQAERETLLAEAIWLRDKATIELVQENGGRENIYMLAALGKIKEIDEYLKTNAKATQATDKEGRSLLHWAALDGQTVIAAHLLKAGAALDGEPGGKNKNKRGRYNMTPLAVALDNNCLSCAEFLLDKGAAATGRTLDTRSPLHAAAHMSNLKMLDRLLAAGADIDASDCQGETALHQAALTGDSITAPYLLEHGAALDKKKGGTEETALALSVRAGHSNIAELLLKAGADINCRDAHGLTPLMVAARAKNKNLCQLLIDYQADKNAVDRQNRTAGKMLPADATNELKAIFYGNAQ